MNQEQVIDELRERIARLEAVKPRRRVYNQQDAARELGMSVNKFRAEQKAGRIRGTLSGRTWLFPNEELERYLATEAKAAAA
jgi:excisionase family DNA binding protein